MRSHADEYEAVIEYLEDGRQRAYEYSNGLNIYEPDHWEYWKEREGLSEPKSDAPVEANRADVGSEVRVEEERYAAEEDAYNAYIENELMELEKVVEMLPAGGITAIFADEYIREQELREEYERTIERSDRGSEILQGARADTSRGVESSPERRTVSEKIGGRMLEGANADAQGGSSTGVAEREAWDATRAEVDHNGHPFVISPDGTTIFGEITDDTGLPSAPIKLSEGIVDGKGNGYGLQHIEARHGEQIRNAGFKSVVDFVKYVAENYDKDNIKVGKKRVNGSGTFIIQIEDEHSNLLYIELSRDGSYWNVNSGGVFRKGYSEKRKNVEPNTELSTSDTALSDKSFVQTNSVDGSESADTYSDNQRFSDSKDTTKEPTANGLGEENGKGGVEKPGAVIEYVDNVPKELKWNDVQKYKDSGYRWTTVQLQPYGSDLYVRLSGTYKGNPAGRVIYYVVRDYKKLSYNDVLLSAIDKGLSTRHFEDAVLNFYVKNRINPYSILRPLGGSSTGVAEREAWDATREEVGGDARADEVVKDSSSEKAYKANNTGTSLFQYFTGALSELISLAKHSAQGLIKKVIAPVSSRLKEDLSARGVVIDEEYKHVIDNNAIRHTLKKHSGKNEEKRGQVPIVDADFDRIADVVENYDGVEVLPSKTTAQRIIYHKAYPDGTVMYVEEQRVGRKELAAVTMWKKKIPTLTDANRTETTQISDLNEVSRDKDTRKTRKVNELGEKSAGASVQKRIEAAEAEVNTSPTEGQKEAGNYKKGHVQVGTFNITIEQPKGSVRSGVDKDGKKWETTMQNTYGYIRGTEGVDGDHIDVFLSDDIDGWNGRQAYVVDQYNEDGTFDEHKVMLGFNDINDAEAAYLSNYERGWADKHKIVISSANIENFEKWIESSRRKTKAFAEYKTVKPTERQSNGSNRSDGTTKRAEVTAEGVRERVSEWEGRIGAKVRVIERAEDVDNVDARQAIERGLNVSGWYDVKTDKVEIYAPNVRDVGEVDRTIVHEVVSHKGLRGMLGEKAFNKLCDKTWDMMSEAERAEYESYPGVENIEDDVKHRRAAADEYISHLAEGVDLSDAERSTWRKVMDSIMDFLKKLYSDIKLTEKDLEEIIKTSYRKMRVERERGDSDYRSYGANKGDSSMFSVREEGEKGKHSKEDSQDLTTIIVSSKNADAKISISKEAAKNNLDNLSETYLKTRNTRGFLGDLKRALGETKTQGQSSYFDFNTNNGEVTLRISNHNANADNVKGDRDVISVIIKSERTKNNYKNSEGVNLTEYAYFKERIAKADGSTLSQIAESIKEMLDTGVYEDKSGIAVVNPANSEFAKTKRADEQTEASDAGVRFRVEPILGNERIFEGLRKLEDGETSYVERKFSENKSFEFNSKNFIKGYDDVAYIFKQLESESVENAFAVLVKEGRPTIIHLGMGSFTQSMVNTAGLNVAVNRVKPDKIYFVHNHPSGVLRSSEQDQNVLNELVLSYGSEVVQYGIIINSFTGKYGIFNSNIEGISYSMASEQPGERPIKVYSFNKQVYDKNYQPTTTLRTSSEVAAFITSQRLGDRQKLGLLVVDNQLHITGNVFLPYSEFTHENADKIANDITYYTAVMGGNRAFLFGNAPLRDLEGKNISGRVRLYSGGQIQMLDYVEISGGRNKSAYDEGTMFRFIGERGAGALDRAEEASVRLDNLTVAREIERKFGEKKSRIEKLRSSKPIEIDFNNEYELNRDSAKQWLKDNIRGEYVNKDTGETISISKVGINEVTSHGTQDKAHLISLKAIPDFIEKSIFIDEIENTKDNNKYDSYRYYVCGAKIGGEDYTVKIVVGVKGDNKYYDHRLIEIEKGSLIDNLNGLSNSAAENQRTSFDVKDSKLVSILQVNDKENAKRIKLATGWERGADGKWRYEVSDGKFDVRGELHPEHRRLSKEEQSELDNAFDDLLNTFKKGSLAYDKEITEDTDMADIYVAGGMSRERAERLLSLEDKEKKLKKSKKHLDDYLDDESLYAAYPELREIEVVEGDPMRALTGQLGGYNPQTKTLTLYDSSKDTLLHEVQHIIQHIEGFATGGSAKAVSEARRLNNKIQREVESLLNQLDINEWLSRGDIQDVILRNQKEGRYFNLGYAFSESLGEITGYALRQKLDEANRVIAENNRMTGGSSNLSPSEHYRRLGGEVEARNVSRRMGMSVEERRNSLAEDTEDVSRADQIFIMGGLGSSERADVARKARAADDVLYRRDEKTEYEDIVRRMKSQYVLRGGGQSIAIYEAADLERVRMILDKDVYEKIESKYHEPNVLGCSLPKMGYAFIFTNKAPNVESTWWHENTHIIYESLELADKEECGLAALNWLQKQGESGKEHYSHATSKYEQSSWGEEGATRLVQYLIETYGAERFLNSTFDGNEKISKLANAIRNKFIYGKEEPTRSDILQRRRIAAIYGISQANGGMDRGGRESSSSEGRVSLRSGRYEESAGVQRNAETQYGGGEEAERIEIREREGAGAYSDRAVTMASDPRSKAIGRPLYGEGKRMREYAARQRRMMAEQVGELAEKLHLDNVEIVTDAISLEGKKARAKGFYSRSTGKITVVIPNHGSVSDAVQTLLHEAVAHHGLRQLFGEHFDTFLDNVYNNADAVIHERIDDMASKNGGDFRKATEEYLAGLAEKTNFEEARTSGWWSKIKEFFMNLLHKIGFKGFKGITLTDNELRYILWRSYMNLKEPGKFRSILGEAEDIARQEELKVGNYGKDSTTSAVAAEVGGRYRKTYYLVYNFLDLAIKAENSVILQVDYLFKKWQIY